MRRRRREEEKSHFPDKICTPKMMEEAASVISVFVWRNWKTEIQLKFPALKYDSEYMPYPRICLALICKLFPLSHLRRDHFVSTRFMLQIREKL